MLKITMPLFVILPRKTKKDRRILLNLNNLPHWHRFTYNEIKKATCEALQDDLSGLILKTPIELHYTIFKGSNHKSDRMNFLTVLDKFFCDALTHYGCIMDDSDEYITKHIFTTGEKSKENPRCEIEIIENLHNI